MGEYIGKSKEELEDLLIDLKEEQSFLKDELDDPDMKVDYDDNNQKIKEITEALTVSEEDSAPLIDGVEGNSGQENSSHSYQSSKEQMEINPSEIESVKWADISFDKDIFYEYGGKTKTGIMIENEKSGSTAGSGEISFDELKKGDKITLSYGSSIRSNSTVKLQVKSKNLVGKGKSYESEKITFINLDNPQGARYYAYKRKDGSVGFAIGDMAISNIKIQEYKQGGSVSEKRQYMAEYMADLMPNDYMEELGDNATFKDGVKWELKRRIKTDEDAERYGEKYESSYITGKEYAKGGYISPSERAMFENYMYDFYGKDKGIYAGDYDGGFSTEEISIAVDKYIQNPETNWGGGDSVDRELARDKFLIPSKYPTFEKGGEIDYNEIKRDILEEKGYTESDFHKGMIDSSEAREIMKLANERYAKLSKAKKKDLGMRGYAKGGSVEFTDLTDNTQPYHTWEGKTSTNNKQQSVGAFSHNINGRYVGDYYLYMLNDWDEEYYGHLPLKQGEILMRIETDRMVGGEMPLIKINVDKGWVYFMSDENNLNSDEDDKNPKFDTRTADVNYLSLDKNIQKSVKGYAKGGELKGKKVVRFHYEVYNNPSRYKDKNPTMYGDKDDPYRIAFELAMDKVKQDKKDGTYEFYRGNTPSKLSYAKGGVLYGVEYKEKPTDRKFKKTSLQMSDKEALEKNANLLKKQEGWSEIRIVEEKFAKGGEVKDKYAVGIRLFTEDEDDDSTGYGYIHIYANSPEEALSEAERLSESDEYINIMEDTTMPSWDGWDEEYSWEINADDDENPYLQPKENYAKGGEITKDKWKSIVSKFLNEFYGDYEEDTWEDYVDSDSVESTQTKSKSGGYNWDGRPSKYGREVSFKEAYETFKSSLTPKELKSIKVSFDDGEYADAEEHDRDKSWSSITIHKVGSFSKGGEIDSYDEFIGREDEYLQNIWDNVGSEDFKTHQIVEQLMKKDNKWHPDYRGYIDKTYYRYYVMAKNGSYAKGGETEKNIWTNISGPYSVIIENKKDKEKGFGNTEVISDITKKNSEYIVDKLQDMTPKSARSEYSLPFAKGGSVDRKEFDELFEMFPDNWQGATDIWKTYSADKKEDFRRDLGGQDAASEGLVEYWNYFVKAKSEQDMWDNYPDNGDYAKGGTLYEKGGENISFYKDDKYWADYSDIGQFSISRSNWSMFTEEDFYEKGKNIVKKEYNGDIEKAYDTIVREKRSFAKGGETESPITNYHKNIMGTLSFDLKVKGMRKPQDFIVYPITEKTDKIRIQSDKKFGEIHISSGRGVLSKSGNTSWHLALDIMNRNVNTFQLNDAEMEELKSQIRATTGKDVGSSFVTTDNSGAELLAKGGSIDMSEIEIYKSSDEDYTVVMNGDVYGMNSHNMPNMSVDLYDGIRSEYPSDISHWGRKINFEDAPIVIKDKIERRKAEFIKEVESKEMYINAELREDIEVLEKMVSEEQDNDIKSELIIELNKLKN